MYLIKFRLRNGRNKTVGYEKWNGKTWRYSVDNLHWSDVFIPHKHKDAFINMRDENRKEIYQNDVLSDEYCVVKFDNDSGQWVGVDYDTCRGVLAILTFTQSGGTYYNLRSLKHLRTIGSVFDHISDIITYKEFQTIFLRECNGGKHQPTLIERGISQFYEDRKKELVK